MLEQHVTIFLSNSNPTWNSTELELVRVVVDFVFQCHNKKKNKKNKKNPHLILIYRKGLQVYNLERVTVWVSRSCLEGVWKVSGRCLEIVWKVSGRCLEGVQQVFGTLPILPISTQLIIPNHPNMTNLTDKPDPTLFWTQIFSGSKFFRDPNFIWTLFFWDPIFVGTQICFGPKFFHYKSTQPDQLDQPNRPT